MKSLPLLISFLAILNVTNAQISDTEFEEILSSSKSMMKRTNYELNIQSFNPISHIRQIEQSTWEIGLQSWAPMEDVDDKVFVLKAKAIVKNFGDHYEFYSVTQPVISYLLPDIQQEKYVQAGRDWLIKELSFSQVRFGAEGNRMTMSAEGDYGTQKSIQVAKDLKALIQVSRGMLNTVTFAERKIKKKKLKEFSSAGVEKMPAGWFPYVVEDNSLWDYKQKSEAAPNGYWTYGDNQRNVDFYVYNYEEEMVYFLTRYIDESYAKQNKEKLMKGMESFVKKNPIKGVSEVEPVLQNNQFYGVQITMKYDGSIKGSTFSKIYWDLWNSYKNKLAKALDSNLK